MKEKMRGMTLVQKIDYLWTYYKIWLLVPVVIGVVFYIISTTYRASQENELVSVIAVGSLVRDTSELENEIKEYIGKKNDIVRFHMSIPADQLAKTSQITLTTLIGAKAVDVILCPEDVYRHFSDRDGFLSMESYESQIQEKNGAGLTEKKDAIKFIDSQFLKEKLGIPYDEVYMGIFINAPHEEGTKEFVQYVLKNSKEKRIV